MKTCGKCRQSKKSTEFYKSKYSKDGLGYYCKSCLKKKKEKCDFCNKLKTIYKKAEGKKICNSCFKKNTIPTKICSNCKKKSFLAKSEPPLCISCYDKLERFGVCSQCGRKTKIKLKGSICQFCYHTSRKDMCDFCFNKNRIAKVVDGKKMCISCYDKQPENISKRFNRHHASSICPDEWLSLMKEFDWKCFYCGEKLNNFNRTIDHIVAKHNGGGNHLCNLIPCCRRCNGNKGTKDIFLWAEEVSLPEDKIEFLKRKLDEM